MPNWLTYELNLTMLAVTLCMMGGVLWYILRVIRQERERLATSLVSQINIPPIGEAFLDKAFSDVHSDIREICVRLERVESEVHSQAETLTHLGRRQ